MKKVLVLEDESSIRSFIVCAVPVMRSSRQAPARRRWRCCSSTAISVWRCWM